MTTDYTKNFTNTDQAKEQFSKGVQMMQDSIRDSLETATKSTKEAVEGANELGTTLVQSLQHFMEHSVQTAQDMKNIKNPREALDLQNKWFQENMDQMMKKSTELSQKSSKWASKSMDNWNAHTRKTMDRAFKKSK